MNIDRLFEQGVSDVSRTPRQMLTDAEIASAAAASKTGAGIWLLAHVKEILIGAISFAVGVGGTLAVTNALTDKATAKSPVENRACMVSDTLQEETLPDDTAVYTAESSEQAVDEPKSQTASVSNGSIASSPQQGTAKTATPKVTATSTTSEPVVIKKTIVRRDTVQLRETVIVKDTVIIN